MKYIKENIKFFIFMILVCIIGGYFTTLNSLSYLDPEAIGEAIKQVGSMNMVITITVVQMVIYTIVFAGLGIILSNKVGLWKKFSKDKKAILYTVIISIFAGLLISAGDQLIFGRFNETILHLHNTKPTINYIISSLTYGGVFEEILMRLFLMSLLSWIIAKIFYKKEKQVPVKVFIMSNIICALLFAVGHLPSTLQIFGELNAVLVIRCFLLNGLFGACFGWLYRKYSIHYAMLAHFGAHLVEIIIWLLFL